MSAAPDLSPSAPTPWHVLTAPRKPVSDPVAFRKIQLTNALVALACLSMGLGMVLIVGRIGWAGLQTNSAYIAVGLALYTFTPKDYWLKSAAVCAWIVIYIVTASEGFLGTGLHNLLLLMPAVFFLLFELRHSRAIAVASAVVLALYLWLILGTDGLASPSAIQAQLIFNACAGVLALYVMSLTTFRMLDETQQALADEHARSERLLAAIMPGHVARRLKDNPNATVAETVPDATVLFADLAGFTGFAAKHTPDETVAFLNRLFTLFDRLTEAHGLDKVKTIGDGYMVAGGLGRHADDHAERMAALALDMMQQAAPILEEARLSLRIGLHQGPVTAGVIGQHKPFFDVWGDTVNMASRMETQSQPGKIQMSRAFRDALPVNFEASKAHHIDIHGKGEVTAFFLKPENSPED